ncbi:MAG: ABC transporter substrate-binding protein, partial [Dolichospermum sp.]
IDMVSEKAYQYHPGAAADPIPFPEALKAEEHQARAEMLETLAFQKGDYKQAAKFFKKAIEANKNDPEVVIYYNNALARQAGSPLTLAVVVRSAEGVLRGVAQAQEQFNRNKGLTGRLLEIVNANDNNDPKQAQQIAQQLVKYDSILGVIGHNSSDTTKEALPEYEKAKLAVISPASTSILLLQNPVFFRVV